MKALGHFIHHQLSHPEKIFVLCLVLFLGSLTFNGGFLHLYGLHRDKQRLLGQMAESRAQIVELDTKLKLAKDPAFVERQALDRYDLAEENDLVFVFADE